MITSLLDLIKDNDKVCIGKNPSFNRLKVYKSDKYQVGFTWPLPSAKEIEDFYYSGFYIKDKDDKAIESRINFSSLRAESQFQFINSVISCSKSCRVLDVGCSEGSLLVRFAQEGAEVFGYEIDQKMAHLANLRLKIFNCDNPVINSLFNSNQFEQRSQKFDVVCSSHVLEHLTEPLNYLKAIKSILHQNGILFLEVPNDYDLGIENCINPEIFPPAKNQGHLYFFSPSSISLILKEAGFKIILQETCGNNVKDFFSSSRQDSLLFHYLSRILTKVRNKLKKLVYINLENDKNDLEWVFNKYWKGKDRGQWIRVIAKPI